MKMTKLKEDDLIINTKVMGEVRISEFANDCGDHVRFDSLCNESFLSAVMDNTTQKQASNIIQAFDQMIWMRKKQ